MISRLLQDAQQKPSLFLWHGRLSADAVDAWSVAEGLLLPRGLRELLIATGGGEIFETERILRPVVDLDDADGAALANVEHRRRGMAEHLWVFHEGFFVSAIRRDGTGIVVMREDYQPVDELVDVDDWYLGVIRPELASRYGL